MALVEYKPGTAFPGVMGRTIKESSPAWPSPVRARDGAPNVLFIVLDDTGSASSAATARPSARRTSTGWRPTGSCTRNMHTTALCSPSRSCMLTGRNHHSNGMVVHHRGIGGLPGLERRHPVRERLPVGDAGDAGLQHLCRRQVAPDARGADQRSGPVRALAARARVRALLRLSRRRHQPVLSGPGVRQPPGRPAEDSGKWAIT